MTTSSICQNILSDFYFFEGREREIYLNYFNYQAIFFNLIKNIQIKFKSFVFLRACFLYCYLSIPYFYYQGLTLVFIFLLGPLGLSLILESLSWFTHSVCFMVFFNEIYFLLKNQRHAMPSGRFKTLQIVNIKA